MFPGMVEGVWKDGGALEKSSSAASKAKSIGKSLGKFYTVERREKHTGGTLSVCRKSREYLAVAGEADGEAGRADGGSEGEQSEFQV